jgi:tetratricopeptide (TPR) repeat protein
VAAGLGGFSYWFLHGSVDWFWEFPALGAPAIAFLAIAARAGPTVVPAAQTRATLLSLRYLLLVPALAAASALALPWMAAREVDMATAGWRLDPAQSFRRLDLAARLNPLDDDADLVGGVIAVHLHNRPRAVRYFNRALARNPSGWFARLELAAIDSQAGRPRAALRQLSQARALDPREIAITSTIENVRHGEGVSPEAIEALLVARTRVLVGTQQR